MACYVTKDPDNTWPLTIDWSDWFAGLVDEIGGTFTLTGSSWSPDSVLIVEEGSSYSDTTKKTAFYGSGGVDGSNYDITNTISYTSSVYSGQTFTEDRTVEVRIREK